MPQYPIDANGAPLWQQVNQNLGYFEQLFGNAPQSGTAARGDWLGSIRQALQQQGVALPAYTQGAGGNATGAAPTSGTTSNRTIPSYIPTSTEGFETGWQKSLSGKVKNPFFSGTGWSLPAAPTARPASTSTYDSYFIGGKPLSSLGYSGPPDGAPSNTMPWDGPRGDQYTGWNPFPGGDQNPHIQAAHQLFGTLTTGKRHQDNYGSMLAPRGNTGWSIDWSNVLDQYETPDSQDIVQFLQNIGGAVPGYTDPDFMVGNILGFGGELVGNWLDNLGAFDFVDDALDWMGLGSAGGAEALTAALGFNPGTALIAGLGDVISGDWLGAGASVLGSVAGQMLIPVPGVGAAIGALLGGTLTDIFTDNDMDPFGYARLGFNPGTDIDILNTIGQDGIKAADMARLGEGISGFVSGIEGLTGLDFQNYQSNVGYGDDRFPFDIGKLGGNLFVGNKADLGNKAPFWATMKTPAEAANALSLELMMNALPGTFMDEARGKWGPAYGDLLSSVLDNSTIHNFNINDVATQLGAIRNYADIFNRARDFGASTLTDFEEAGSYLRSDLEERMGSIEDILGTITDMPLYYGLTNDTAIQSLGDARSRIEALLSSLGTGGTGGGTGGAGDTGGTGGGTGGTGGTGGSGGTGGTGSGSGGSGGTGGVGGSTGTGGAAPPAVDPRVAERQAILDALNNLRGDLFGAGLSDLGALNNITPSAQSIYDLIAGYESTHGEDLPYEGQVDSLLGILDRRLTDRGSYVNETLGDYEDSISDLLGITGSLSPQNKLAIDLARSRATNKKTALENFLGEWQTGDDLGLSSQLSDIIDLINGVSETRTQRLSGFGQQAGDLLSSLDTLGQYDDQGLTQKRTAAQNLLQQVLGYGDPDIQESVQDVLSGIEERMGTITQARGNFEGDLRDRLRELQAAKDWRTDDVFEARQTELDDLLQQLQTMGATQAQDEWGAIQALIDREMSRLTQDRAIRDEVMGRNLVNRGNISAVNNPAWRSLPREALPLDVILTRPVKDRMGRTNFIPDWDIASLLQV